MVVVPDRFIFLETPRTASRSVAVTMEESIKGAKRSGCRHVKPEDVPQGTGLPIWTITRHPMAHLYSWYKYGIEGKAFYVFNEDRSRILRFSEFAEKEFCPLQGFEPNCLNIYHAIADHFWPLERGLVGFYRKLQIVPKKKHKIGEIKGLPAGIERYNDVVDIDNEKFRLKFKSDISLYRSLFSH